ncbi:MAG: IclR family transcriptional regulator [Alphaproteobacteria bacterium]|nr:IclR family transcriptional regulator [Alphaproteobacteria bacterium]
MTDKRKPSIIMDEETEIEAEAEVESGNGRQFIWALARGLDVLRAFRVNDPPLSNQELAKRTGFPRPTISRITHTLTELGYLTYHERYGCYELGGSALVLGHVARANFNPLERIRPAMQRLAEFSNANVGIGARDRLEMIYLDVMYGPSRISLRFEVGSKVPILSTAMGRAYIAAAPDDEVASLVKQFRKISKDDPDAPQRIVNHAKDEFSRLGFCSSTGDWTDDIHGIAAPVMAPDMGGLLAINVGAPAYLMPKTKMMTEIGPELVKTAAELSEIFGQFHGTPEFRPAVRGRPARGRNSTTNGSLT